MIQVPEVASKKETLRTETPVFDTGIRDCDANGSTRNPARARLLVNTLTEMLEPSRFVLSLPISAANCLPTDDGDMSIGVYAGTFGLAVVGACFHERTGWDLFAKTFRAAEDLACHVTDRIALDELSARSLAETLAPFRSAPMS